eukprot:gene5049-3636_t
MKVCLESFCFSSSFWFIIAGVHLMYPFGLLHSSLLHILLSSVYGSSRFTILIIIIFVDGCTSVCDKRVVEKIGHQYEARSLRRVGSHAAVCASFPCWEGFFCSMSSKRYVTLSPGSFHSTPTVLQSWASNPRRPWMCIKEECRSVSKGNTDFCEACGAAKPVLRGWKCVACQTKNFSGIKFCKKCKESFEKSSEYWLCAACEEINKIDEIEDNSRCGFCGYDMAPPSVSEEEIIRRGHEQYEESRRMQEQFDSIKPDEAEEQFGDALSGSEHLRDTKLPLGGLASTAPAVPGNVLKPYQPPPKESSRSKIGRKKPPLPTNLIPPGPPGFDWMCRQTSCGHINPGDEEACMKCGEHITPVEWECPFCAALNHMARIKCFSCQSPIPISWTCHECKTATSIYDKQCRSCSTERLPAEPKLPHEVARGNVYGLTPQRNQKKGDWLCAACNAMNFGWRTECYQCASPRTEAAVGVSGDDGWSQSSASHNNWYCSQCQASNFRTRGECWQCGTPNNEAGGWSSTENTPKFEREGFQDGDAKPAEGTMNSWKKADDWACAKCFAKNFKNRTECYKCGAPRMTIAPRRAAIRKPVKLRRKLILLFYLLVIQRDGHDIMKTGGNLLAFGDLFQPLPTIQRQCMKGMVWIVLYPFDEEKVHQAQFNGCAASAESIMHLRTSCVCIAIVLHQIHTERNFLQLGKLLFFRNFGFVKVVQHTFDDESSKIFLSVLSRTFFRNTKVELSFLRGCELYGVHPCKKGPMSVFVTKCTYCSNERKTKVTDRTQICRHCGTMNDVRSELCEFCVAPLQPLLERASPSVPLSSSVSKLSGLQQHSAPVMQQSQEALRVPQDKCTDAALSTAARPPTDEPDGSWWCGHCNVLQRRNATFCDICLRSRGGMDRSTNGKRPPLTKMGEWQCPYCRQFREVKATGCVQFVAVQIEGNALYAWGVGKHLRRKSGTAACVALQIPLGISSVSFAFPLIRFFGSVTHVVRVIIIQWRAAAVEGPRKNPQFLWSAPFVELLTRPTAARVSAVEEDSYPITGSVTTAKISTTLVRRADVLCAVLPDSIICQRLLGFAIYVALQWLPVGIFRTVFRKCKVANKAAAPICIECSFKRTLTAFKTCATCCECFAEIQMDEKETCPECGGSLSSLLTSLGEPVSGSQLAIEALETPLESDDDSGQSKTIFSPCRTFLTEILKYCFINNVSLLNLTAVHLQFVTDVIEEPQSSTTTEKNGYSQYLTASYPICSLSLLSVVAVVATHLQAIVVLISLSSTFLICFLLFSRSPVWRTPVNNFIDEHCYVFDNESEMKLEYTAIHKEFVQLIDSLITNFVNELGVPPEEAMEALHTALASKETEIGGQVDRFVTYIYGAEDFRTFHRMMMRRNVELDILAMRALKEQGTMGMDMVIPDVDDVLGLPPQSNNERSAAMRENAGYDEEEALRLAIEESLKDQGMSGKRLELEDAQLQEALALSTQMEADKARAQKKEVIKEVAVVAQSDPAAAANIQAQKTAIIEQQEAQKVQELEVKTLQMREEKVREMVEKAAVENSSAPAPTAVSAPTVAPAPATTVVGPPSFAPAKNAPLPPPSFGGKTLGFAALPSLPGLGQPPLSALKEKVVAEKQANPATAELAPTRQPTKEEFEERARYMREQREKILQRNRATRQQELQEYAKQNSVEVKTNSSVDEAEKQLTIDIARRLRGDILGELRNVHDSPMFSTTSYCPIIIVFIFPVLAACDLYYDFAHNSLHLAHRMIEMPNLLLTQVECDEVMERTAILSAEQNNFSRFVSLRIFERHGAWNFSNEIDELRRVCHNCGTHCPFCSDEQSNVSPWRRTFELHGRKIRTPFCSEEEQQLGDSCQYAFEAAETLSQRHEFYKQEGQALLRIQRASKSIRRVPTNRIFIPMVFLCNIYFEGNEEAVWEAECVVIQALVPPLLSSFILVCLSLPLPFSAIFRIVFVPLQLKYVHVSISSIVGKNYSCGLPMRLRVIGVHGAKSSVFVDVDDDKPIAESFHVIEEAFGCVDLCNQYDLYPSAFVDNSQQKIRCVNSVIDKNVCPKDLDLPTGVVVLRPKARSPSAHHGHESSTISSDEIPPMSRGHNLTYRERLCAIYSAYDPPKLRFVDGTLQKYKGREEAVIRQLVLKYGPEPSFKELTIVTEGMSPTTNNEEAILLETFSPCSAKELSPFHKPEHYARGETGETISKLLSRFRESLRCCMRDEGQRKLNSLLKRYFAKWVVFRDHQLAERALRSHVWRRTVNGYQLVDNVDPPFEISDICSHVRRQRISRSSGAFSDKLQKALRELLSTVTRLSDPFCDGVKSFMGSNTFNGGQYTADDFTPVRDTESTAAAVQHSARYLVYLHELSLVARKQKKQHEVVEEASGGKARTQSSIQRNGLTLGPNGVKRIKALEAQVEQLNQQLRESRELSENGPFAGNDDQLKKIQNELAKTRAALSKHRASEREVRKQLEEAKIEEAKLREQLQKKKRSRTPRLRTPFSPTATRALQDFLLLQKYPRQIQMLLLYKFPIHQKRMKGWISHALCVALRWRPAGCRKLVERHPTGVQHFVLAVDDLSMRQISWVVWFYEVFFIAVKLVFFDPEMFSSNEVHLLRCAYFLLPISSIFFFVLSTFFNLGGAFCVLCMSAALTSSNRINIPAVCRIHYTANNATAGTGVLVGPGILLTSAQVVENKNRAAALTATFFESSKKAPVHARLLPDKLFFSAEFPDHMDYCIVACDENPVVHVMPVHLPLIQKEWPSVVEGDLALIVQHRISEPDSDDDGGVEVKRYDEILRCRDDLFFFKANGTSRSAGCPVFIDNGQLIGIQSQFRTDGEGVVNRALTVTSIVKHLFANSQLSRLPQKVQFEDVWNTWFVKADVSRVLLIMANFNRTNMVRAATQRLCELTTVPSLVKSIAECGGIPAILSCMDLFPTDEEIALLGLKGLWNVSIGNNETLIELVQKNGLEKILTAMERFSSNEELMQFGTVLLFNIAKGTSTDLSGILGERCLSVVYRAAVEFHESLVIQKFSINFCSTVIQSNAALAVGLVRKDVFEHLANLIETWQTHVFLMEIVMQFVSDLAQNRDVVEAFFLMAKEYPPMETKCTVPRFIDLVMDLMIKLQDNQKILLHGNNFLWGFGNNLVCRWELFKNPKCYEVLHMSSLSLRTAKCKVTTQRTEYQPFLTSLFMIKSSRSSLQSSMTVDALEYNSFSSFGPEVFGSAGAYRMPLRSVVYHIFKGNVGAGVFLLPTFYQESGFLLGIFVIIALGYIIVDCSVSLIEVKHKIADPFISTYPSVVRYILGPQFESFTNVALTFSQFGFCVMYLQYSASMMASIMNIEGVEPYLIILCAAIVTPLTFLSHRMELLAYGSLIAGVCVSLALVGTFIIAFQTLSSDGISHGAVPVVLSPRILLFISGYLFSLEGIGIVLPIEKCLDATDKPKFGFVLRMTLFGIISMYLFFGVVGYLAYGEDLTTSVVLALPKGALRSCMELLVVISLILSFPVQYVPAIQLLDMAFNVNMETSPRPAAALRVSINIFLAAIAAVFGPEALNMVASFIGAFGGVHLMITIPTLLSLVADLVIETSSENLHFMDYVVYVLNGPRNEKRARRLFYLLLTMLDWLFTMDRMLLQKLLFLLWVRSLPMNWKVTPREDRPGRLFILFRCTVIALYDDIRCMSDLLLLIIFCCSCHFYCSSSVLSFVIIITIIVI